MQERSLTFMFNTFHRQKATTITIMTSTAETKTIKYIYDLPYPEWKRLCEILNLHDRWETLAGEWMKYDILTIQNLRKQSNPTEHLLQLWSTHNHTVLELFVLLSRMHHYHAMTVLKPFVEPKFHVLITRGEENMQIIGARDKITGQPAKDSNKIGQQNFNQVTPYTPAPPKVVINVDNSEKILNRAGPSTEIKLPQISYDELCRATDCWSEHKILGRGGFGTVYRGTWKNTDVAIKKIRRRGPESDESYLVQLQQSLREITILNSRPHENILSLYAYSMVGDAPCLIYQFMRNGSLEDRLALRKNTPPLTWLQRHEIAKGTARGLQYLHTIGDKPLIHGDIKSANILLDKNFEPRIGDFGLAREGSAKDSMKVSKIHGTRPYLPDEFLKGKNLSTKIDTYSYGIVLFELATGLSAYDDSRPENKFLKDFMDCWSIQDVSLLKDKRAGDENSEVYHNLIVLGKWCSNRLAKDRPEMELVFRKLDDL